MATPLGMFLVVGPLLSAGAHLDQGFSGGLGGELSLHLLNVRRREDLLDGDDLRLPMGGGVFVQAQAINLERLRVGAGLQATALVCGLELGGAYESGGHEGVGGVYLHAQPFVSVGFLSIGIRVDIPVTHGPKLGPEVALVLAPKLPLMLGEHPLAVVDGVRHFWD